MGESRAQPFLRSGVCCDCGEDRTVRGAGFDVVGLGIMLGEQERCQRKKRDNVHFATRLLRPKRPLISLLGRF